MGADFYDQICISDNEKADSELNNLESILYRFSTP